MMVFLENFDPPLHSLICGGARRGGKYLKPILGILSKFQRLFVPAASMYSSQRFDDQRKYTRGAAACPCPCFVGTASHVGPRGGYASGRGGTSSLRPHSTA